MEVYWEAGKNGSEKFVQLIGEHEHNVAPNMIIQNIKIKCNYKIVPPDSYHQMIKLKVVTK